MHGTFTSLLKATDSAEGSDASPEEPLENVGRRAAARLRTSIPASLISLSGTKRCILIDVSRTGAQISLPSPIRVGDSGFLRFANFEVFASAMRAGVGLNGLSFDCSLSDADVLATRHYAETFEEDEQRALRDEVRAWVSGVR